MINRLLISCLDVKYSEAKSEIINKSDQSTDKDNIYFVGMDFFMTFVNRDFEISGDYINKK